MSEPIRARLRELGYGPCTDGYCLLRSAEEQKRHEDERRMHTNGGCRCVNNVSERHAHIVLRMAINRERRARTG